jgi:hypothetical protein
MIQKTKNGIIVLMVIAFFASIASYALNNSPKKKAVILATPTTAKNIKSTATINHRQNQNIAPQIKGKYNLRLNQTMKWQVPNAAYRLIIKSTKPELPGYIDLNRYCLPGSVDNGIDIRNTTGGKLAFQLLKNHGVIIDAAPQTTIRVLYFGFAKPLSVIKSTKNKSPNDTRLKLTVINGRLNYLTGEEWIQDQKKRIIKRDTRREEYYLKSLNQYLERGILPRLNFAVTQCFWWDQRLAQQLLAIDIYQQYEFYWRPTNRYTVDLKTLRRYNLLLYYSLSGYFSNISWRVRALRKLPINQAKQLKKLHQRVKGAHLKAFTKLFNPKQKRWQHRVRGTEAVAELNLERRPFDARRNFGAIFSGKLIIPQTGEYSFAVNSTSSTVLQLDGKNIFTWLGAHDPATGWGKTIKQSLKAGLYDFKLYYHKASGFTQATVAWQPPNSTTFAIMNENNFAPGWLNDPIECNAIDGTQYPIIERTAKRRLFIGKRQRAIWTKFHLLTGKAQNYEWQFNDKTFPGDKIIDIIFNSENHGKVTIIDKANKAISLQLKPIPNSDKLNSINPDLQLKLWLPTFIYDDELLNGQIEISSNLPDEIACRLHIEASRQNTIMPSAIKILLIPAKSLAKQAKFAAASIFKINVKLNGSALAEPLAIKLSLELPGMIFDQQQFRFIPLKKLPLLKFNGQYLTDQSGIKVIPILHRPTLSELRSWELPAIVKRQFHKAKKVTVIASDFGRDNNLFSQALKASFYKKNIKVEFLPWHKSATECSMLNSLPSLLPQSLEFNSDTVVIIPPSNNLANIASIRLQGRTLAALLEQLRQNPNINYIYLATPFPRVATNLKQAQQLNQVIKQLCKRYNVEFIKLHQYITQQDNWQKAYQVTPGSSVLIASYPLQLRQASAEFISKQIAE